MSAGPIHHKWREFADLPADLEQFRDRELESLFDVWQEQRPHVDEKAFSAELAREWSIETGIIEGVYTLDRGTTEILIRRGIDSSYIKRESTNRAPEIVAKIIATHQDVLEGLFDFVAQRRELSTGYIKELHAALLRDQEMVKGVDQFGTELFVELKRGAYKEHPNNPVRRDKAVHEYCPPEHVASEMDRLVALHKEHDRRGVSAVVEAAWLHHSFTQIHPFQDGNGRVARAIASVVLIKAGLFPLVVVRDDWEKYIDALEAGDEGDLKALVELFARLQKRDLRRAIVTAASTKPVATVHEAIDLTRNVLARLQKLDPKRGEIELRRLQLRDLARNRFHGTARKLEEEVGTAAFRFREGCPAADADGAIFSIDADGVISKIVVEFGTPLVTGTFDRSTPLYDEPFRIEAEEPLDVLRQRFLKWLDDVIIRGLAEWRKTLV